MNIILLNTGEFCSYPPQFLVRLDLVGTKKGYWCDVCRTAVVGKPTNKQNRIWDIVVKSYNNIIAYPILQPVIAYALDQLFYNNSVLPHITYTFQSFGIKHATCWITERIN